MFKKSVEFFVSRPRLSALLLGGLFTLGFAPFYLWILALLTLSGLIVLVRGAQTSGRASLLGFLFGLGHFVSSLYWLVVPFYMEFGHWGLAFAAGVPSVLLLSTYLAFFTCLACGFLWRFRGDKLLEAALFAGVWTGLEYFRGTLFTGFPWNLAGYVWADNIYLMQLASVGAIWSLSFAFVLLAGLLVAGGKGRILAGVLIVSLFLFGQQRLANAPETESVFEENTFLLMGTQTPQREKWARGTRGMHFEELLSRTVDKTKELSELETTKPLYIIWPETAATFFLEEREALRRHIMSLLPEGAVLVTGAVREGDVGPYNSVFALGEGGEILADYNKKRLVPFGEYVPLRGILPSFIGKMVHGRQDYSSGAKEQTSFAENLPISFRPLVCFEAVFPRPDIPEKGVLLTLSNDGWFQGTIAAHQHFAMARFRAVEMKVPVIRVTNQGINAKIDRYGRIVP